MTLPTALLESVAAEAVRSGLADAVFTRLPSPIGRLLVVSTEAGLCRVGFAEQREDELLAEVARVAGPRVVASDALLADVRERLAGYLEGDDEDLTDLPVDLRLVGSPFRLQVLSALRQVPRGGTVTYATLAARAGRPRAARAVGSACATNPVPIVVPCHRVLPTTGRVGGYGGGAALKRRLLALEGVAPRA